MNKKDIVYPVLRWAGGKRWLTKDLENIIADIDFNNYYEPFIGGASLFLAINPQKEIFLSDLNYDLINTYKSIKENPEEVIKKLRLLENTKECYDATKKLTSENLIEQAVRFIYLNKTSFNGIYRVNSRGEYNVPFGNRKNYRIDEENILAFSKRLQGTQLQCEDFELISSKIRERDLIILDPPYTVSHNNNGFVQYNQKIFSLEDQYRLKNLIDDIKSKGAYYLLTNAGHSKIEEIFYDISDIMYTFERMSLIGGKNAQRGLVKEFVFTNIIR